jgi:hypothetical protein
MVRRTRRAYRKQQQARHPSEHPLR